MVDDEPSDSTTIIKKILGAKLFDDESGTWKRDVRDIDGEVLCGQSLFPSSLVERRGLMEQSLNLLYLLLYKVQNQVCTSIGRVKEVMADSRFP
jgi:hypothetical protein